MSEFRLWLLIVVSVGLAIFAVQNASMSMALMFLNMQSVTLPLSAWMLLSLAAGVLTSFLISGSFKLSNYLLAKELAASRRRYPPQTPRNSVPPMPSEPTPAQPNTTLQSNWGAQAVGNATSYASTTSSAYESGDRSVADTPRNDEFESRREPSSAEPRNNYSEPIRPKAPAENRDDYEEPARPKAVAEDRDAYEELVDDDDSFYEDWEEEEPPVGSTDASQTVKKDPTTYEVQQEPKTISHSGTIYSIGYRDPNDTAVGKNESVYDADYRVINSPIPPVKESAPDEDDWGKKRKQNQDW